MADYDLPTVMQALQAADAAGNTEDARQLADIAHSLSASSPAPTPQEHQTPPNASLGGEFYRGAVEAPQHAADLVVGNLKLLGHKLFGDEAGAAAQANRIANTSAAYNQHMADNPVAVPSYSDIHNAHDLALYGADTLGSMAPYVLGTGIGGAVGGAARFLAPALTGAAIQGSEAYDATQGDPAATAAGAGLGAAAATIPVPFLKSGGGIASKVARGALGGALAGGVQGASANIPEAVHTGNLADATPSGEQIIDSAIRGAAVAGLAGGIHGAVVGRGSSAVVEPNSMAGSKARLAERIQTEADNSGVTLGKNVRYGAPKGDEAVLENVHNSLAEDIKGLTRVLRDEMAPEKATDFENLMERTSLQSTLRDARNKLKGSASEADIAQLKEAVGHTKEGIALIDLVQQSNHLTDLFRSGMKGGISQFTDYATPFTRGGRETGRGFGGPDTVRVLEALHFVNNPAHAAIGTGAMLAGRGIDALTGQRSRVARFVRQNLGDKVPPLDYGDSKSLVMDRFKSQRSAIENLSPEDRQRIAGRERELLVQKFQDNNPGLGGFLKLVHDQTGLLPQEASVGVHELQRTGAITPEEFLAFHTNPKGLMESNVGNHMMDMLDNMARKGQLQRDPTWNVAPTAGQVAPTTVQVAPTNVYSPAMAQARGNQDRVSRAIDRVSASNLSPSHKEAINYAIAAIGRTNNRADANAVRNALVGSIQNPAAKAYASQETQPLVAQIRHPTREAARKAVEGRDLTPLEQVQVAQKAERLVSDPTSDTINAAFGSDAYDFKAMLAKNGGDLHETLVEFTNWVNSGRPAQ